MIGKTARRFYKQAAAAQTDGGFSVTLDGRAVRTPAGQPLLLPTRALAEEIAEEWQSQGDEIKPATMPMMQLAATALDRIRLQRLDVVEQIVNYARTDLVCYRAGEPVELVARQEATWGPVLDWLAERYGARLTVTNGVIPVPQDEAAVERLRQAVLGLDDLRLAALSSATAACGSLVLALALVEGRLNVEETFVASQVDETFQIELWGEDAEAADRRDALRNDIAGAGRFLGLCRQ